MNANKAVVAAVAVADALETAKVNAKGVLLALLTATHLAMLTAVLAVNHPVLLVAQRHRE